VFSDLLTLLADADVPLSIPRQAHAVVGDELAHADLCAEVAGKFGAPQPRPRPLPSVGVELASAEERRRRALEIILVEGAIGETVSCALATAAQRLTEHPDARAALSRIVEEGARHVCVFWDMFDALLAHGDGEYLHDFVPIALGAVEQSQLVSALRVLDRGGVPFDPLWSKLGVLSPADGVDAFYEAIDKRVLPALTARGLDGSGAWAARYTKLRQPGRRGHRARGASP
jgi:hypothetical protein